ncbi:monocarboxylate transporter 12-like [Mercenaria mercenaria]|uniref:monocarboxylate transporter 12-like n=1 Tax=Mercenaria mercenaria TaxID=6596 RepID=UPI00234EAAF5|nr:monocarboxylate transporter 12-like [Mercenaria mercenaria]
MTEKEPDTHIGVNGEMFDRDDRNDQASVDGDSGIDGMEINGTVEDDHSGAPIDRGWAWVVLAACVFEIAMYGGLMRSFGVFFLQYQMRFNSNASETALMSMIQNIMISTTALFVMTIGLKKFSSRVAVFTGGVFTVAAYLITAFTTDIRVFYFAQGVLGGVGMAFIHPPVLAILGVYFNKHRGLANSIFMGGGSIGGLIFAPVVVKLFDEYQYTGTLLICSALLMNICVSALLMRPIESYSKKKMKFVDEGTEITAEDKLLLREDSDKDDIDSENLKFDEIKLESDVFHSDTKKHTSPLNHALEKTNNFTRMQSYDPDLVNRRVQGSPSLQRLRAHSFGIRQRTISEDNNRNESKNRYDSESNIHHSTNVLKGVIKAISRSQVALYTSGEGICGSFIDINIPSKKDCSQSNIAMSETKITDTENIAVGCCLNMKSCILSVLCTVFDLSLLRNPVFITYLFMAFSIMSGVALIPVYVPPHAKDIGISNEKIGLMISLMAIIDLVSKVTMGVVADRMWIKRSTILVIVTFMLGTTSHLMRFVNSFPTMIIFVVIAGICCGQYMSVYAVLLMEVIGPEKFKSSLGFGTLVHGTSIAVFFPIAGLLRDITGSYVASFHLLGGLAYLAGVLAFIIPIVNKRIKKKKQENETAVE